MAKVIQDILIYESGDGGEFALINEDIATVSSITNTIYLALFGGNVEQSTDNTIQEGDIRNDWWGNNLDNMFNSTFEKTLSEVSLNSAGLKSLEEAAINDLLFLKDYAEVSVYVSIATTDSLSILIIYQEPDQQEKKIKFIWNQLKNEIIQEEII